MEMKPIIPIIPGNYPGEFEIFGYHDKTPTPEFTNYSKVILATDLRRFTETMEDLNNPKIMGSFLSKFLDESAEILCIQKGLINKYLGDGFLAHFSVDKSEDLDQIINHIMKGIFEIFTKFNQLKENHKFLKLGLSFVLSLNATVPMGRIGKIVYTDYSMIGRGVNSIFKALDVAKGNLILIFDNISEFLDEEWMLINLGTQTYDGIYTPIKLYSVLREKNNDEKEKEKALRSCVPTCKSYYLCEKAWRLGLEGKEKINCYKCITRDSYPCWHWRKCKVKHHYGKEHNGHENFECCHICSNFRHCYHSYFLGKANHPMVWCEINNPFKLIGV